MNSTARACLGLLTLGSLFAFVACSDDDDGDGGNSAGQSSDAGAPSSSGSGGTASTAGSPGEVGAGAHAGGAPHGDSPLECQVLGELCHAADTGAGPAQECHELGHVGNADVCAEAFDGCVATCTETEIGAGGAGGAPGADAHCVALGSLCHPAGEVNAEAEECHEIGHRGVAADCAESFAECATLCLEVLDGLEEGAGGAASGGASSGGAGGAR